MNMKPKIAAVLAVAQNGVIGRDGDMPWRLSTDLKRFKALTLGKPVIMGRKTWDSVGRPLPGRPNIVISRDAAFKADGAHVVTSLPAALQLAQKFAAEMQVDEISVIGGGNIYAQAMPLLDRIYLTRVLAEIDGDTFFSDLDETHWRLISTEDVPAGDKDSHATRYMVYEKQTI